MITREQMVDEVIKTRGFKDRFTIWFTELAESDLTDDQLMNAFICAMVMPTEEDEEEE